LTVPDFWFSPWVLGALGLCIGSFLNVVVHRMPRLMEREWIADLGDFLKDREEVQRVLGLKGRQVEEFERFGQQLARANDAMPKLGLVKPRSRCPSCGHQLAWHENVPLFGWLRLRGKCSACGVRISARYPVVEALTGLLFAVTAWTFGPSSTTLVYCTAIALLVAAAFIDLDTTLLPDDLTFPLAGLGLMAAWLQWTPIGLADSALGLLFGYFSLWAVAYLYKLVRGRIGMAEGDFKLLAGLGALLGWQQLLPIILLSSGVGAAVGVGLILLGRHKMERPIPFGPYLVGGGLAALFFGQTLLRLILPELQ
jgi:leader peptidase (prepilin peptidase) / N-methyltransferase